MGWNGVCELEFGDSRVSGEASDDLRVARRRQVREGHKHTTTPGEDK